MMSDMSTGRTVVSMRGELDLEAIAISVPVQDLLGQRVGRRLILGKEQLERAKLNFTCIELRKRSMHMYRAALNRTEKTMVDRHDR